MIEDHQKRLAAAFKFRPVASLNLPEWADKFRRLGSSTAAVPGPWTTSRVEIARGPMMAMTEDGVSTITVKSSTQLMKTELLLNALGYLIHQRPCPVLYVLPKEAAVKSFSKERFASMVRATPALRDILGDVARDKSAESLAYKEFPGGFIAMESAGSPANLAARPIRVTLLDEIDKFEDLKSEGDPVLLAEERTSTFPDALHIRCCSPTITETSRIERSYLESDQRKAYVGCPHCGHEQALEFFKHVSWDKSEDGKEHYPLTAAIYCESCGAAWSELERQRIVTTKGAIKWRQTRAFTCCAVDQDPTETRAWDLDGRALCTQCSAQSVSNHHAGFTAGKLYASSITVVTLAEKWIAAKDDMAQRQVFMNTQLGLSYSAQAARRVESHVLASRREAFPAPVPRGILRLTAGVDVQGDRLEVHVVGWGYPLEAWSVAYEILPGDPSKPELWNRLDEVLRRTFAYEMGREFKISATCIDSGGHHTENVYAFCKARSARNIWAVKGSSWSRQGDPVWPPRRITRTRVTGFKPVILAVDSAKDYLRQMLLTDEAGPGFFHIPSDRPDAWLDQLTAEACVYEKKAGTTIRKWILPRGRANEAFDCTVYAYAALRGLEEERGLKLERASAQLENFVATVEHEHAQPAEQAPTNRVRRSSWMGADPIR